MNKNMLVGLLGLFVVLCIAVVAYAGSLLNKEVNAVPVILKSDQFIFTAKYKSITSEWEYEITGYLPNPCTSAVVTPYVMESYPEQVRVVITTKPMQTFAACTQAIVTYKTDGKIKASQKAGFSFLHQKEY